MKTYGYIRVSSTDQNEDRQVLALAEKGILIDKNLSTPTYVLTFIVPRNALRSISNL